MKQMLIGVVVGLLIGGSLQAPTAQSMPVSESEPAVSDLQRAQYENLVLQRMMAQKDYEIAQYKFDRVNRQLESLVKAFQREGYTFDTTTFTYTKSDEKK